MTDAIDDLRMVEMPAYAARFGCIGQACEDNCCHDWAVAIDVGTFASYLGVQDPALRQTIRQHVLPQPPHNIQAARFARILLEPDGCCPFQTEERLCAIQAKLGPELLSTTCHTYPRISMRIGEQLQRAALLSCPEAARLALLDPNSMELVQQQEPASARTHLVQLVPAGAKDDVRAQQVRAIRAGSVGLLRRREHSIEARLMALGLIFRGLQDAPELDLPTVAASFERYEDSLPVLEGQLARIAPQHGIQLELLRELMVERFAVGGTPPRSSYRDMVDNIGFGLGLRSDAQVGEQAPAAYAAALQGLYEPYLQRRPWLMENLLVSSVYTTPFPVDPARSLFDEYVMLVVRYAMVKLHLVGMSACHGELTDELMIRTVYMLQRAVEHDGTYCATRGRN